ncbi:hypothetical protein BJX66DRAFT_233372 [Aspergillus keveii]|uniref:Uncharacterized protein n=1 Tax=Aspergillus keveii TaxID=714993 RepID=A0ABR4G1Y8_9EURO
MRVGISSTLTAYVDRHTFLHQQRYQSSSIPSNNKTSVWIRLQLAVRALATVLSVQFRKTTESLHPKICWSFPSPPTGRGLSAGLHTWAHADNT